MSAACPPPLVIPPLPPPSTPDEGGISWIWGILTITYSVFSFLWYCFIASMSWNFRLCRFLLSFFILSPLSAVFSFLTAPLRFFVIVYYELELLIIFSFYGLLCAVVMGAIIGIAAHYLTEASHYTTTSILGGRSDNSIFFSRPSLSRHPSSALQNTAGCDDDDDGSSEEESSLESDDDPWASKQGLGTAITSKTAKMLLATPSSIKKHQKIVPGLLNETIHEEEDSDYSGISAGN